MMSLDSEVVVVPYQDEHQLPMISALIEGELSEPYNIYTYRYFLPPGSRVSFLALDSRTQDCVGVIICKVDNHKTRKRGYIGMLAVKRPYRKLRIGTRLAQKAIEAMKEAGADEVVLEAECSNSAAIGFYQSLGFLREKLLNRYYLNGSDAYRLKLSFNE